MKAQHPKPPRQYRLFERGYCYLAAFEVQKDNADWSLVHGVVLGVGGNAAGLRYGHAWLEKDGWVYDPITHYMMPAAVYYEGGNVSYVARYTRKEAREMMARYGHYGSWDPVIAGAAHKTEVHVSLSSQS